MYKSVHLCVVSYEIDEYEPRHILHRMGKPDRIHPGRGGWGRGLEGFSEGFGEGFGRRAQMGAGFWEEIFCVFAVV